MKLHILISLLIGVAVGYPSDLEDRQNLALEELKQNVSSIWAEISDLKASLETHIKESDPQYYYDPTDHHHHDDHHGHPEGDYHGDHHHDHHSHEGGNQTADGAGPEGGYDHAYDDHHSHHEYDHHHHHHDDYDHHHQHEGSENVHDPHYEDPHHQDHHHDDAHHQDHHHEDPHHQDHHHDDHQQSGRDGQEEKDDHSQEDDDDNSEENVVSKAKTGYYGRPRNDSPQPDGQDHHHDQEHHQHHQRGRYRQKEDFLKAHCHLLPNSEVPESNVSGHITITQKKDATGPLYFKIFMKGFQVSQEEGSGYVHGFHIHENEVQGQQCSTAGPHFNPDGKTHGAPYAVVRHVGDLGNIRVDHKGRFENRVISDDVASFFGKSSIIGRSIVVHQKADDLGLGGDEESLKTGNAGARLACCTIESVNIPKPVKPIIRFNG